MRNSKKILEALTRLDIRAAELTILANRMDAAIITQYPDSARAAEAYEALRKGVITMASAATMQQQNLISLANAIDEGATIETLRNQLCDLLSTLNVQEFTSVDGRITGAENLNQIFKEVGDSAHQRSAWVRIIEDRMEVVQKGCVKAMPQGSLSEEAADGWGLTEARNTSEDSEASSTAEAPSMDEIKPDLDGSIDGEQDAPLRGRE
jgi:hypothetical protein